MRFYATSAEVVLDMCLVANSFFHGGQRKYLSPDGHNEAVYDRQGQLLGGRYRGTYNYGAPGSVYGNVKHVALDMAPHIIFGP